MRLHLLGLFLCLLFTQHTYGQGVGINTDNSDPDASAALDVKSTNKGILIPRLSQAQRDQITTPATGLLVFQTDQTPGFYYYNGTNWQPVGGADQWTATNNGLHRPTGNVGIGTDSATAVFDVQSTTSGSLALPRMTTAQRNAITQAQTGMMIFNTSTSCIDVFQENQSWYSLCALTGQTQTDGLGNVAPVGNVPAGFVARGSAAAAAIGNKFYIGLGRGNSSSYPNDFWEFDMDTQTWTQKADFPGTPRMNALCLSIGARIYVIGGSDPSFSRLRDTWMYDPATNTWTQKSNLPIGRARAFGFVLNGKGYIGGGTFSIADRVFLEYDPVSDTWTQKANTPEDMTGTTGFAVNGKGYACAGSSSTPYSNRLYEYDPTTNTWTQKANFPGGSRTDMFSFGFKGKGYVGMGSIGDGLGTEDIWEYDPATNTWKQKANYPGGRRLDIVGAAGTTKAVIGTGYDRFIGSGGAFVKDIYLFQNQLTAAAPQIGGSTFPAQQGGSGQILTADGNGNAQWQSITAPTLTLSGQTLRIAGGNAVDLPPNTDNQTLTLTGQTLSIAGGNSITIPNQADNLGNHSAGQNLSMNDKAVLFRSGGDNFHSIGFNVDVNGPLLKGFAGGELGADNGTYTPALRWTNGGGLRLFGLAGTGSRMVIADENGNLSAQAVPTGSKWQEDAGKIYRNGLVGIGTTNPISALHITGDRANIPDAVGVHIGQAGPNDYAIELASGEGSTNAYLDFTTPNVDFRGRILYNHGSNAFSFFTNGANERLTIAGDGSLRLHGLAGTGSRMVVADNNGVLSSQAIPTGSKWQENTEKIYREGSVGIFTDNPDGELEVRSNLPGLKVPAGSPGPSVAGGIGNASNMFDNDVLTSGYTSVNSGSSAISIYFRYDLDVAENVVQYSLTLFPDNRVSSWTLSGSNDANNWQVIDTRSGEDFINTRNFTIQSPGKYRYYRFHFTSMIIDSGGPLLHIQEMRFLSDDNFGSALKVKAGKVRISDSYDLPNGAGSAGQFLQTDGSGNTSWQSTPGDNLGNHAATQALTLQDNALLLRGDTNHALRFASSFAGLGSDGPALYGYAGGLLGSRQGSAENIALRWNNFGATGGRHHIIEPRSWGSDQQSTLRPSENGWGQIGDQAFLYNNSFFLNNYRVNEYVPSDRSVKQNITPMEGALASLMRLQPSRYDLNPKTHPLFKGKTADQIKPSDYQNQMGFVAQELAEVFPEMVVFQPEWNLHLVKNYEQLFPVLTGAIQEQQQIIEAQAQEIQQLKADIAAIKAKLGLD